MRTAINTCPGRKLHPFVQQAHFCRRQARQVSGRRLSSTARSRHRAGVAGADGLPKLWPSCRWPLTRVATRRDARRPTWRAEPLTDCEQQALRMPCAGPNPRPGAVQRVGTIALLGDCFLSVDCRTDELSSQHSRRAGPASSEKQTSMRIATHDLPCQQVGKGRSLSMTEATYGLAWPARRMDVHFPAA